MSKNEYLKQLGKALGKLRDEDKKQALSYYEELIDDHMEEGLDEELAVSKMPSIEEAVKATYDGLPPSKRMVARFSTGNVGFNICLLILLFPIWLPLGICFFVLTGLSFLLIWLFDAIYYIILGALGIASLALLVLGFISMGVGFPQTLAAFGASLIVAGLFVLLLLGAKDVSKFAVKPTVWLSHGVKSIFVKEGK